MNIVGIVNVGHIGGMEDGKRVVEQVGFLL